MRALPSLLTKISVTKSGAMYPEPPPPPYRFLESALPPCAPHPPLPASPINAVRPAVLKILYPALNPLLISFVFFTRVPFPVANFTADPLSSHGVGCPPK